MSNPQRLLSVGLIALLALVPAACTGSSSDGSSPTTVDPATTNVIAAPAPITIVVTNDDGIGAPGIDELAQQLDALDNVTVKVVAPAANQSGKGDSTTTGEVAHHRAKTISGIEGIAVEGTPADSVNVAMKVLGIEPDLVASGINLGQNVGPLTAISGTVGAALTAVRLDIPAVAGSAGFGDSPSYESAARSMVDWIKANHRRIAKHQMDTGHVVNFNVPECTAGSPHGLVKVPTATKMPDGVSPFSTDCSATKDTYQPTNDVDALVHGFAAQSKVMAATGSDPATSPSTTG